MLNNHEKDLINRSLDDELDESERAECEALLARSEEAREYSDELSQLANVLSRTPSVEPPEQLQQRILSQIQLPRPRRWFTRAAGWMQGRPVSYGVAAAAGLLVGVAFYELTPVPRSATDYSSLVGTLVRGNGLQGIVHLSFLDIDEPGVQGKVYLSGSGDLKLLRFDVDSQGPVEFEVGLSGSGLTFGGFAQEAEGGTDNFRFSGDSISVTNLGTQRFTVILRDTGGDRTPPGGVVVSVRQDGEAMYRGVLSL